MLYCHDKSYFICLLNRIINFKHDCLYYKIIIVEQLFYENDFYFICQDTRVIIVYMYVSRYIP